MRLRSLAWVLLCPSVILSTCYVMAACKGRGTVCFYAGSGRWLNVGEVKHRVDGVHVESYDRL
jgi:hypothetical protein